MALLITPGGRLYETEIGRFLQRDPAERNAGTEGNLCAYARNDPLGSVDPTGFGPFAIRIKRLKE